MPHAQLLWLFALCLLAAILTRLGMAAIGRRRPAMTPAALPDDRAGAAVLLFDGDELLDASPDARVLLATDQTGGRRPITPGLTGHEITTWQQFLAWVAPRFPGADTRLEQLSRVGRLVIRSTKADGLTLTAEWRSGIRHVTITSTASEPPHNELARQAQEDELHLLRELVDQAPLPIWREDAGGAVIWANPAYLALADADTRDDGSATITWPLPQLIHVATPGRAEVRLPGAISPQWFDCHITNLPDGRIIFALPADAAVAAESTLAAFVQTLTKTFAQLPIGLAIFDRERRLQLFNPALGDLTGLAPEFLSARPGLYAVLDALRAGGMIPEPRNYKDWRAQMAALEESSSKGLYEDTWVLTTGQTWRVSGRPHPEGALALLVEDISAEITRTRRMRADLELGQAVIDAMDEAIAVFSAGGRLLMSNRAYVRLWGDDPSATLTESMLPDLLANWRKACAPNPLWDILLTPRNGSKQQPPGRATLHRHDGRTFTGRIERLAGGVTLIGFAVASAPESGRPAGTQPPAPVSAPAPASAKDTAESMVARTG